LMLSPTPCHDWLKLSSTQPTNIVFGLMHDQLASFFWEILTEAQR